MAITEGGDGSAFTSKEFSHAHAALGQRSTRMTSPISGAKGEVTISRIPSW